MPCCQSTTPWPSTSSATTAGPPGELGYFPGVIAAWVSPFHLSSFSITTVRAGMLMPSASVSVREDDLHQAGVNRPSTTSLKAGSTRVMRHRCRA